jgi:DNA segregation ATPase FtsK/SpoIIIE-like protein
MKSVDRPLRVFLCHSSNDKPAVRELYQKLRAEPWIQPWLDEEELYPGQDWNMEIEKAIEATDVIIVCLSKNSITKEGYVQKEIKTALDYADYKPEGTLFIIPIRLEECEPPRSLSRWQYTDYFEDQHEHAFERLIVSLKKRTESLNLNIEFIGSSQNDLHIPTDISLLAIYGVESPYDFDIDKYWYRFPDNGSCIINAAKIGASSFTELVSIDLRSQADGPNGIILGYPGWGKQELIHTLITTLSLENHPHLLSFVFIDLVDKGVFNIFDELPHSLGISSGEAEFASLDIINILNKELLRRQRALASSHSDNIEMYYDNLINNRGDYISNDLLPHLVMVVDGISDVDSNIWLELVGLARAGRDLGLHIILSTDRIAGVVSDVVRSSLNFRIVLKVNDPLESMNLLWSPVATTITKPGRAYIKGSQYTSPQQFQIARVSGLLKAEPDDTNYSHKLLSTVTENSISDILVKNMKDLFQSRYPPRQKMF